MVDRRRSVVVTGGAGFIGRHVVAALNQRGYDDVTVVDHLDGRADKVSNLSGLSFRSYLDRTEFLEGVGRSALDRPIGIIHLGACSSTLETDAHYLAENNYRYTRRVCEWAATHGVRFVYASSAATYGSGAAGYLDDEETLPALRPTNRYARSKHVFDLWARATGALRLVAGIKFFNVYGSYEAHKGPMRSVVLKAFEQLAEHGVVRLFRSHVAGCADGEQSRDFVDVRDAAAVAVFLFERPEVNGLFNCGTGRARTWNELASLVARAMGRAPSIEYVDMPGCLRGAYQYHTCAHVSKLRAAGYDAAFIQLEEGIEHYVRALLAREAPQPTKKETEYG
jgi:ADP-L-glycero-D-manno-heptose 6-epimerase